MRLSNKRIDGLPTVDLNFFEASVMEEAKRALAKGPKAGDPSTNSAWFHRGADCARELIFKALTEEGFDHAIAALKVRLGAYEEGTRGE